MRTRPGVPAITMLSGIIAVCQESFLHCRQATLRIGQPGYLLSSNQTEPPIYGFYQDLYGKTTH